MRSKIKSAAEPAADKTSFFNNSDVFTAGSYFCLRLLATVSTARQQDRQHAGGSWLTERQECRHNNELLCLRVTSSQGKLHFAGIQRQTVKNG